MIYWTEQAGCKACNSQPTLQSSDMPLFFPFSENLLLTPCSLPNYCLLYRSQSDSKSMFILQLPWLSLLQVFSWPPSIWLSSRAFPLSCCHQDCWLPLHCQLQGPLLSSHTHCWSRYPAYEGSWGICGSVRPCFSSYLSNYMFSFCNRRCNFSALSVLSVHLIFKWPPQIPRLSKPSPHQ